MSNILPQKNKYNYIRKGFIRVRYKSLFFVIQIKYQLVDI